MSCRKIQYVPFWNILPQDGSYRIDNNALVALTLMIAVSKPSEKDVMVKVILNSFRPLL